MQIPILRIIIEYFSPLVVATESKEHFITFVKDVGWKITLNDDQYQVIESVLDIKDIIESLIEVYEDTENENITAGRATEQVILLAEDLHGIISSLQSISGSNITALPSPMNEKDWWKEFALKLPNYLLMRWLYINYEFIYESLHFVGAVLETPREDQEDPLREFDWNQFSAFLKNPHKTVVDYYKWGQEFDQNMFMFKLWRLLNSLSLNTEYSSLSEVIANDFYSETGGSSDIKEINTNLLPDKFAQSIRNFKPIMSLAPVPHATEDKEYGLFLNTRLAGEAPEEIALSKDWTMDYSDTIDILRQAVGINIQHDAITFETTKPDDDITLKFVGEPEEPWILFGNPDGIRLELSSLSSEIGLASIADGSPDLSFGIRTGGGAEQGLKLYLTPKDGDSFIREILGDNELAVTADAGLIWSLENGLQFEGGAGFEVIIPVNKDLGPITLSHIRIMAGAGTDGAILEIAVTGGLDVSVISFVVEDIGMRAELVPVEDSTKSGLLGNLDLKLGLKPPIGLGLAIDGGIVKGGGYLSHDESKFQYAGIAEVGFVNLGLSAIGILNTKMPDGSDGWSLFLSIFSEFPPIQLGFGFTLNGVGGLVGLHRALDDDALRERLLTGAMDSIMFPEDPVANAPKIISDISAVFPSVQGQFIFGAMMKIGWGTPSLITVDLGVMVELPDPVRIALIGQVAAMLPTPEVTIVELHMDVFGIADLSAGTFALDAVLRDSHIMHILTLSGDMAMRASLISNPTMLLSVGGFNPKFKPPAEFPQLRRMKASLPVGKNASVDVSCYLAFTSNTLQFGGRVDVWAKFSGFTAEGYLEMDALIQYVPFGFQFHTGFGVSVRAGSVTLMGVDVTADIIGPAPWEIYGKATFEILKIKKKINLSITAGNKKENVAEHYNVTELITAAFTEKDNWAISEDDNCARFINFREQKTDEDIRYYAGGSLTVSQRIAPLNTTLETFGGAKIDGNKKISISKLKTGDTEINVKNDDYITEWFASANFFNMTNNEKITAPSFEEMESGVSITQNTTKQGLQAELTVDFEEIYIDKELNLKRLTKRTPQILSSINVGKLLQVTRIDTTSKSPFSVKKPSYDAVRSATLTATKTPLAKKKNVGFAEMNTLIKQHNIDNPQDKLIVSRTGSLF